MTKRKIEPERKSNRKPMGTIGPIVIGPERGTAEFRPIHFPKNKAELESHIARVVVTGLRNSGTNFYQVVTEPIQNPENDFDFTLRTTSGDEYLELMEVAALEHVEGSYEAAPASYNHGQLADYVYEKLMSKARKYRFAQQPPVHLLLYTTDWRFRLGPHALALLAFWSIKQEHCFKTILYFVPDDATRGEAKIIYPVPIESFANFDEHAARNRRSLIGDPTRMRVNPDGSVDVPLGFRKPK